MKWLLFVSLFVLSAYAIRNDCKKYTHYWRPYSGTIPEDALLGGMDDDGKKSYIGRMFVPDTSGKIVPAQIFHNQDHVDYQWCCNSTLTMRVDKHIEILCAAFSSDFSFQPSKYAEEYCCLVEAATNYYSTRKKIYTLQIGRKYHEGRTYIGQTSISHSVKPLLYFMYGSNSTVFYDDFEVLAYDCRQKNETSVRIK